VKEIKTVGIGQGSLKGGRGIAIMSREDEEEGYFRSSTVSWLTWGKTRR